VGESAGGMPLISYDLPLFDITMAHPARLYDFLLGGCFL
jgi:hypothetical protein